MEILKDISYMIDAIDVAINGVENNSLDYGGQVGAVLVKDGLIISSAHNKIVDGQRMHAEEIILNSVSLQDTNGATLYVTLEPCNSNEFHHRKHCSERIVSTGIERVVIGAEKRNRENGIEYMMGHGITIDILDNERILKLCNRLKEDSLSEKTILRISTDRDSLKYIK